jgi:hypothetical protein
MSVARYWGIETSRTLPTGQGARARPTRASAIDGRGKAKPGCRHLRRSTAARMGYGWKTGTFRRSGGLSTVARIHASVPRAASTAQGTATENARRPGLRALVPPAARSRPLAALRVEPSEDGFAALSIAMRAPGPSSSTVWMTGSLAASVRDAALPGIGRVHTSGGDIPAGRDRVPSARQRLDLPAPRHWTGSLYRAHGAPQIVRGGGKGVYRSRQASVLPPTHSVPATEQCETGRK